MKRLIGYVCLILLVAPAMAQQGPPPGGPDLRMFLELDDAQVEELGLLQQELRARLEPVAAQVKQTERQLHEELSTELPNPVIVGELVIAIRQGRQQVAAIRLDERQRTTAVLTPEQQEKLNPLRLAAVLRKASAQAEEVNLIGLGDQVESQ